MDLGWLGRIGRVCVRSVELPAMSGYLMIRFERANGELVSLSNAALHARYPILRVEANTVPPTADAYQQTNDTTLPWRILEHGAWLLWSSSSECQADLAKYISGSY
jgi:hypothetical protein